MSAVIVVLAFLSGLAALIALMARLEPVVAPAPLRRSVSTAPPQDSADLEPAPQASPAAA